MKLIVGLGNPGRDYGQHRHNIGFRCVNYFARKHGLEFNKRQARSQIARGRIAGVDVMLAKPQTFMNLSGQAVALLVQQLSLPLADLIVVYDDLDLPLGKIRIREKGSAGGHRGMQSIIDSLGSQDFPRIRVGLDRPPEVRSEDEVAAYVLSEFTSEEQPVVTEAVARVSEALECILSQGIAEAMNQFNQKAE
jgi:PTH1 family peptidyl-tRNA hydrolase